MRPEQPMDEDWLVFHPDPKSPSFCLPDGAVDAHCHVFGPSLQFPFAPERKYTPCNASKQSLFKLRDHLGFSRNVIVQATCHGTDNRAMMDACRSSGDCARGVASVRGDVSREELMEMHHAGVRGVRFNFVRRLVDNTPRAEYFRIAQKVREFDWSIVVYFEVEDLVSLEPFLRQLTGIIVVDHIGRPNVANGIDHPNFQRFIRLMDENENIWAKVTCPERLTTRGFPYDDVVPFHKAVVERFADRVLWGTDWPHPNMKSHMPDDGVLVDYIPRIATTADVQHQLLVANPMRLYWSK